MTRFDSPTQVVILFTGAVLVSVVLIMLLNAEANNRRIVKEPEIENGNLFTSLGRGVKRLVRSWVQDDNTTTVRDNSERLRRSLTSAADRGFDSMQHPVRHAKHKTKTTPTTTTTTTDVATSTTTTVAATTTTTSATSPSVADEAENATARNGSARIVTKRRVDAHDICYNTHEVLLIITVTCGVNFAFVFFVMICVRTCSRSNKVEDIYVPCGGDSPTHTDEDEFCNYKSYSAVEDYCHSTSSYSSVQEYVNSLPQAGSNNAASSMLSLHSLYLPLHPVSGEKKRRKSRNSLHTAYSMEDLLLM